MTDNERFQYLIEKIIENKKIWLLKAEEGMYAMLEDDIGQEYIPIWPEKKDTLVYSQNEWENYQADEMTIYEFINWMKELSDDKVKIAAYPNENNKIIPFDALEIKKILSNELAKR